MGQCSVLKAAVGGGGEGGVLRNLQLGTTRHGSCSSTFDQLRVSYLHAISTQHEGIIDVTSGKRLDVMKQCVPRLVHASSSASAQHSRPRQRPRGRHRLKRRSIHQKQSHRQHHSQRQRQ